ncbi:tyrosyl-DNA phosphodiesterase 1-like isoform X1 [Varroa jacobsoni]|uniref:tyrosyl-DNA phosphodiesterase 1-like isoform X1 n=1 Tax=Varroa jacobsoni TaxID=62625 RepID=UPI000BF7339E|nr:tyrosyl-DNA phosphodiesterase 1-like isoform X1 [Varroa jacobsoni]
MLLLARNRALTEIMAGPRKVHEISDSDDSDVEIVSNVPKKSRQAESPDKNSTKDSTKNDSASVSKISPVKLKPDTFASPRKKPQIERIPHQKPLSTAPSSSKLNTSFVSSNKTAEVVCCSYRPVSVNGPALGSSHCFVFTKSSRKDQGLTKTSVEENDLKKNEEKCRKIQRRLQEFPPEYSVNHLNCPSKGEPASHSAVGSDHNFESSGTKPCPYGFMCYRTSSEHLLENSHDSRLRGFYLTKCEGLQSKFNSDTFTRSLKQILHEDVSDQLESAVHFSYVYDMEWLLEQYPPEYRQIPMLLVVQQSDDLLKLLIAQRQVFRNVALLPIELSRFGTHHSKMISLKYKGHLRLIVTTANLYGPDWGKKSQMLWVSPLLKKSSQPKKGQDSDTGFRSALCTYLRSYQKKKLLELAESYADYDFSLIDNCYFIGSTPNSIKSGLVTVDSILTKNVPPLSKENPVTFCFSSIGTLGQDDTAWLRPTFGRALLANNRTTQKGTNITDVTVNNIQALYPTIEEVRKSFEGYEAGRSLPYSGKVHMKQRWLSKWLHRWKADQVGRSRAAPHVKFYIRTSPDYQRTFWFLMSSANLSKAAWGNLQTKAPLSYECGILYVPNRPISTDQVVVPFDLPPQEYSSSDRLWIQDNIYNEPDDFGHSWDPRQGGVVPTI